LPLQPPRPWSRGERRILNLAASLADGTPARLRDTVPGLDNHNTGLHITRNRKTPRQLQTAIVVPGREREDRFQLATRRDSRKAKQDQDGGDRLGLVLAGLGVVGQDLVATLNTIPLQPASIDGGVSSGA
jgi:hypothetical protein